MFEKANWLFEVIGISPIYFWLLITGICVYAYIWKPVYKSKTEKFNIKGTKEGTEETTISKRGGFN